MREILFRGKDMETAEWIYGWYCMYPFGKWPCKPAIIPSQDAIDGEHKFIEIDPSTVGQFTGLTDKNGKRIFKHDIVKFKHGGEFSDKGIYYRNYEIQFVNSYLQFGARFHNKSINFPCKQSTLTFYECEVIGNIYDSPELLGDTP